jgi:ATP-dependent helicase HrpA
VVPQSDPDELAALAERIAAAPPPYQRELKRRLNGLRRRARQGKPWDRGYRKLTERLSLAEKRREARRNAGLRPDFDLDLPVIERKPALAEAIRDNQVVVVCGETGSGKSTQLPKICLDLGLGIEGMIAHSQPRRIAARSLAERVAEECHTDVGHGVGYRIRFNQQVRDETRVKLATDGMLLAETQSDPDLAAYDTLIIDEAHERSLNIDFLLGYLKRLLARRPDLKLIITSATIDPDRFSRHFDDAPVLHVSGRTYPVDVRYRPLATESAEERDRSLQQGILDGVDELAREGTGDILVFLPSERDIREAAENLRKHHPPNTEILPLFGRLSSSEQQRVFAPHDKRRVVLATNVAETSLTVPGIRYVIDSGLVRLSRYSYRTKVQRLPIEPIAQASADQRAGRCGREAAGICLRLYSQEDYESRPAFTDPEILRTNLAAVILQMRYLGLGAVEDFPFVESPDPRYVRDGIKLLRELGALDANEAMTDLGQRMARLSVDPRVARLLIAGQEYACLSEVLVLAAALSIQDPRERPMEAQGAADAAQQRWQDKDSDFNGLLRLWYDARDQQRALSNRQFRRWCRDHFLSFLRIREWREVYQQLREQVKGMGVRENEQGADYRSLHRALLTGLLSNVALRTGDSEYTGPRNLKLMIFPGSGLAKRRPKWIMAAELVETSRVFARGVGEVRPEWIEAVAGDLVSRHVYEPFWQPRKGRVGGYEDIHLYGLPLASRRKINYASVDPSGAREVFIREALVEGRFRSRAPCLAHNREVIESVQSLEAKARRRDVLVDPAVVFAFYDQRLPAEVVDGPSFERWVRKRANDQRLRLDRDELMAHEAFDVTARAYPDQLAVAGLTLPLQYHFEPGHADDGVTAIIPVAALNQLQPEPFEWLVPGLVEEKVSTLIRALPKQLRKNFVPAPDFARAVLEAVTPRDGSLAEAVRDQLQRMTGVSIPVDAWDDVEFPDHLRMNFRAVDADGRFLDQDRNLVTLQRRLANESAQSFNQAADGGYERSGLKLWQVGELPDHVAFEQGGVTLYGYPALVDEGASVALRLQDTPEAASQAHRGGVRRLLMLALPDQAKEVRNKRPGLDRLTLLYGGVGSGDELRSDLQAAVFDQVFLSELVPRDPDTFERLRDAHRGELIDAADALIETLTGILERHHALRKRLNERAPLAEMAARQDIDEQLTRLIYPGFITLTPSDRLSELPRYLDGIQRRLDRLSRDPQRDEPLRRRVRQWVDAWEQRCAHQQRKGIKDDALEHFRWLLEEYRVSVFAQELGTREKVSDKRLAEAWSHVR